MAGWLSRGSNNSSKDEAAAAEAGKQATRFGKLVDKMNETGRTAAAKNITDNAGRADSQEELKDGATRRGQSRGRGDDGQSR